MLIDGLPCWCSSHTSLELISELPLNLGFLLVRVLLFLCVVLNFLGKVKRGKKKPILKRWTSLLLSSIWEKEPLLHAVFKIKEFRCLPCRCEATGSRRDWMVSYQKPGCSRRRPRILLNVVKATVSLSVNTCSGCWGSSGERDGIIVLRSFQPVGEKKCRKHTNKFKIKQ